MKKILFLCVLAFNFLYSSPISSIALKVNDEIITTYDIQSLMQEKNINQKQAVDLLVDQALYNQEIEKHNIRISEQEYTNYLHRLAQKNGITIDSLKSMMAQKYGSYEIFENQTKQKMIQEKLVGAIARGKIKVATSDDLKIYYDKHSELFKSANVFDIVEYASKNKNVLLSVAKNPMIKTDLVSINPRRLTQTNLNPQIRALLNSTPIGTFTPVLKAQDGFVMLYLKNKSDFTVIPFEQVKSQIFDKMMYERESSYVKDYFEKLKLTADIEVVK
jgi:parvulin-like peptidyl-prolyl isomerase